MSNLSDSELVDPPGGEVDHTDRPCPIPWCKAKKRQRSPPLGKYDTAIRYTYGECRDSKADYAGMVHVGRLKEPSDDQSDE